MVLKRRWACYYLVALSHVSRSFNAKSFVVTPQAPPRHSRSFERQASNTQSDGESSSRRRLQRSARAQSAKSPKQEEPSSPRVSSRRLSAQLGRGPSLVSRMRAGSDDDRRRSPSDVSAIPEQPTTSALEPPRSLALSDVSAIPEQPTTSPPRSPPPTTGVTPPPEAPKKRLERREESRLEEETKKSPHRLVTAEASSSSSTSETTAASTTAASQPTKKKKKKKKKKKSEEDFHQQKAVNKAGKQRKSTVSCGYCGAMFETRSSLFRHLRNDNACRTVALSHGMPVENPLKRRDTSLRKRFGDVLLAGCVVLHRKPEPLVITRTLASSKKMKKKKKKKPAEETTEEAAAVVPEQSEAAVMEEEEEFCLDVEELANYYECVIVHNRGGRLGFPKGKIELGDVSVLAAALRETWEEAGLSATTMHVLPDWAATEASRRCTSGDLFHGIGSPAASDRQGPSSVSDGVVLGDEDDDEDDDESQSDDEDLDDEDLDDDDDDDDLVESGNASGREDTESEPSDFTLSVAFASIDVREVTGRQGKRARYFVCGINEKGSDAQTYDPPPSTKPFKLSATNDNDDDIEEVEWVNAARAFKLLGHKRRTALKRAMVCFEVRDYSFSFWLTFFFLQVYHQLQAKGGRQ